MPLSSRDESDLEEAIRHCSAGLKALETARDSTLRTGTIYPTHLHLAAVELAHAIESAMRVSLRTQ